MKPVKQICVNPDCEKELSFASQLIGTIQPCPHCDQRVRVVQTHIPKREETIYQNPHLDINLNKRTVKSNYERYGHKARYRTQKKVKASSGCLAMAAVLLGGLVIAIGLSFGSGFSWSMIGKLFALSGLLSIAAFAYFGYFAIEEDDNHAESNQKRRNLF